MAEVPCCITRPKQTLVGALVHDLTRGDIAQWIIAPYRIHITITGIELKKICVRATTQSLGSSKPRFGPDMLAVVAVALRLVVPALILRGQPARAAVDVWDPCRIRRIAWVPWCGGGELGI